LDFDQKDVQGEDIKVWGKIGPVIRDVWGRLARFFSRGDGAASTTENPGIGTFPILAESSPSGILAQLLSFKSESEPEEILHPSSLLVR